MRFFTSEKRNAVGRFSFLLILTAVVFQPICSTAGDTKPKSSAKKKSAVSPVPKPAPFDLLLPNGLFWPTNASKSLSSSFAETRSNHFHFGIDIRTNGRVGYPCYAIDDGYVSRIKVSPYGYGRALYFTLKDGRTIAAFAHLQKFAPLVEKVLHEEQMRRRNFTCEMFFQPEDLPFKKGEVICYTGNTGAGPPHLHFEIRDEKGYCNPNLFGFTVSDSIAPMPRKLGLFPLGAEAEINSDYHPQLLALTGVGRNRYSIQQIPNVFGPIGLGVSGHDQVDESGNALGFYGLDLILDGKLFFSARYDSFGYYKEKMIDIERDYRLRKITGDAFHHLWRDPACLAGFYRKEEGILDTRDFEAGEHAYEVVVTDFAGNAARITGKLNFKEKSLFPEIPSSSRLLNFLGLEKSPPKTGSARNSGNIHAEFFDGYAYLTFPAALALETSLYLVEPYQMPIPIARVNGQWVGRINLHPAPSGSWTVEVHRKDASDRTTVESTSWYLQPIKPTGGDATSTDNRFRAEFVEDAVYRTLYVRTSVENTPTEGGFVGSAYHLKPDDMPIKGNVRVSIAVPSGEKNPEQLAIYGLSPKGGWRFMGCDRQKNPGFISGSSPRMGSFALRRDAAPPVATWMTPAAVTSQRRPQFKLAVKDNISGFNDQSVNLEVDGQFVLMEYFPEAGTIFGSPDQPLSVGNHQVVLTLSDFCGNQTRIIKTIKVTSK